MKQVEVYTDGACSGNPGPGGWGAVLRYRFNGKVYEKELSGGDASTTNNRMELTAFIEALRQLKEPCEVRLCSDSQYVINGLEKGLGQGLEAPGLEKSPTAPCPEPRPLGAGAGAGSPPQAHLRLGQRPRRPPGERTLRPACGRPEPGTWRETGTMNDAFLPGNGFDTYEEQDRVLMGLSGSVRSGVAVRILQQQGFAVAAAVVRLADTPEEHAAVDAAKRWQRSWTWSASPSTPRLWPDRMPKPPASRPCSLPPTSWASSILPPAATPASRQTHRA